MTIGIGAALSRVQSLMNRLQAPAISSPSRASDARAGYGLFRPSTFRPDQAVLTVPTASSRATSAARTLDTTGAWRAPSPPARSAAWGFTPQSAVGAPTPFDALIDQNAQQFGVDPTLIRAVMKAESGFNPRAVSHAGAKGLMQLMDGTANRVGVRDPFDPAQNIRGGVSFLRDLLDRFGDVRLALAAYNAGPGAVERYGGVPPYAETQAYVGHVLDYLEQYRTAAGIGGTVDRKG